MKRSESAKYARWSAAAALLLASLTAGVYLERKWVAYQEQQKAPPPAPQDVTRLSSGLTFSKGEGTQKIFTVEASKATDFRDKDASLLEDVKITIFGKKGERHDTIHTQSCQYETAGGNMACSGEVQIDLESRADAERAAKNPGIKTDQKVHVETRGVVFNRATGLARTDQPVKFVFPSGSGDAVGVEYFSEVGTVRLLKDVQLRLRQPESSIPQRSGGREKTKEEVLVTGSRLEFGRETRTMHLFGPAEAETQSGRLSAPEMTLLLDDRFHAQKLIASTINAGDRPHLKMITSRGQVNLGANVMTAQFATQGWMERLEAEGVVVGSLRGETEEDDLLAGYLTIDLWPRVNQLKEMTSGWNCVFSSKTLKTGETRKLNAQRMMIQYGLGKSGERSELTRAETLDGPGSVEWTDAVAPSGTAGVPANREPARTKLQADKLEMEFGTEGKAKQLIATSNVLTERTASGKPAQTATAQSGTAQLMTSGGWSQMDLQGNVKLKEGDRSGQADHATFVRATQTALLTGRALARDATTETQAPRITFVQTSGEVRAEGGVRSTDFSAKGSGPQLAAVPANISADTMLGNSKAGKALYNGHARFWQGDSVMEADSIELLREARVMNATGNVRAVFPQAAAPSSAQIVAVQAVPKKASLWHVTAGTLTYRDAESRAHLEKNVVAQSVEQKMRAATADLFFTRAEKLNSNATNVPAPPNPTAGAQQISRAVGTGGVIVEQGTRKATAERGEYSATDGKFIMSGGNPAIYDAAEGTTTGRQLTFFLADDTIIVDSETGSRTLTKHRVD